MSIHEETIRDLPFFGEVHVKHVSLAYFGRTMRCNPINRKMSINKRFPNARLNGLYFTKGVQSILCASAADSDTPC